MAENKTSFVSYCDWLETFEELTDEEAGKLVKHLFRYVNDLNPDSDKLTKLLFIPIQQSLKRDLKKYEQYIDKQRVNGQKGGRPKKPKKPKQPNPLFENPTEPKKADSVSVSVSVNDSVNVSVNDIKKELNNNLWIEQICIKKKLEIIDVKEYLNIFINDLELKDDIQKPIKELKKHFINWLNIQVKNVKKEIPKTIADKYAHLI